MGRSVKRFRQVVAIRTAPPALFTLAQAEEHLALLASAERSYEAALAAARASGQNDVAEAAARALSAITTRVPSIVVRLERPVPGATATIDLAAASLGEPVKVDPGSHVVAIQAPNRRPFEARVDIAAGQSIEVPAALEPLPPAAPPVAPPAAGDAAASPAPEPPGVAPEGGRPLPVGPLVVGGAGVALGIVGLVVRLTAQSSYDGASARCPGGGVPDAVHRRRRQLRAESHDRGDGAARRGDRRGGRRGRVVAHVGAVARRRERVNRDALVNGRREPVSPGS